MRCPYCHGFEFSNHSLGVLHRNEASLHQALLITEWGPTTLFLNGERLTAEQAELLEQGRVAIEPEPVVSLEGKGVELSQVLLAQGGSRRVDALYLAPQSRFSSSLPEQLGLEVHEEILGPLVCTDENRMSSIAGVYAVGDIARARHSVSWAVADGVTAGVSAHRSMVFGF